MKTIGYAVLLWGCVVSIAHAEQVGVRYEQQTYFLSAEFDVEALPKRVMQVLTDYDNLAELNPAIIVSELVTSPGNATRIRTVVHDCVLFFCKDITRVEDVTQVGNEKLEAIIIPLLSDLRSGHAEWKLKRTIFGTTVSYEANMQPKFWVPPIIRSYVLKRKFRKRVSETVKRLQKVASSQP